MCGDRTAINGTAAATDKPAHIRTPYEPVGDVSNLQNFKIIESTLREGEQFANAFFDTQTKIKIATALSDFGVEYLELTSPVASQQSREDCEAICKLGLKAKILTRTSSRAYHYQLRFLLTMSRCPLYDGVDGVDLVIGTSSFLREHSHGKDMVTIEKTAIEVINYVKSRGIEVRFSSEDSFRSDLVDLLQLYRAVDVSLPSKGPKTIINVRDSVLVLTVLVWPTPSDALPPAKSMILSARFAASFHATSKCICTTIRAVPLRTVMLHSKPARRGERNGITSLGGLLARMMVGSREYVMSRYKLHKIKEIEDMVADAVQIAGIHAKAILANPSTYEILSPEDYGLNRCNFASRLTGWNAIKSRVEQLGLSMSDAQVKEVTAKIKQMADIRPLAIDDTDSIIRSFHLGLQQ
ncbi:putative homocitrate synthase [Trichoderma cornu-damae]|uniref:Homocitrate synthase n=1 Tax=Trichoderma cornu-damae TaxID=654480 RepID=A0A9P8QI03_9HYPO|nr:putative homocitrate synthase [Trichoderma cornu-damae]